MASTAVNPINPIAPVGGSGRAGLPARSIGGELAKALLIDTVDGTAYPVMFNPEEFSLEQGNTFAEVGIPGLAASPIQYVRGKARVLAMELFFDTYEAGIDVRTFTAPITQLLDQRPQTQAPPVLLFSLGRFQFQCVLADAGQRFTMFLRDGTPVRSTMTVRLQEYVEIDLAIEQGLFLGPGPVSAAVNQGLSLVGLSSATVSAAIGVHVVIAGDTLSSLAGSYLGDVSRWREIADANDVPDPLALSPGTSLVIPGGSATGTTSGTGSGSGR